MLGLLSDQKPTWVPSRGRVHLQGRGVCQALKFLTVQDTKHGYLFSFHKIDTPNSVLTSNTFPSLALHIYKLIGCLSEGKKKKVECTYCLIVESSILSCQVRTYLQSYTWITAGAITSNRTFPQWHPPACCTCFSAAILTRESIEKRMGSTWGRGTGRVTEQSAVTKVHVYVVNKK